MEKMFVVYLRVLNLEDKMEEFQLILPIQDHIFTDINKLILKVLTPDIINQSEAISINSIIDGQDTQTEELILNFTNFQDESCNDPTLLNTESIFLTTDISEPLENSDQIKDINLENKTNKENILVKSSLFATEKLKLECSHQDCKTEFRTNKALKLHQKTEHEQFFCSICLVLFNSTSARSSHVCKNECDICRRTFTSLECLKRHKAIHDDIKPFTCDQCGNSFRQQSILARHLLTHSKVNTVVCDICQKGFRHKHYLHKHKLVHTGEKPHKCDTCGKGFTQRSNLAKHIKQNHSSSKEFSCSFCDKTFVGVYYLNRHLLTHKNKGREWEVELLLPEPIESSESCLNIRTIGCPECSVTVKNVDNLHRHMLEYHSILV